MLRHNAVSYEGLKGIDGRMKQRVSVQSIPVPDHVGKEQVVVLQCGWSRQEVCPFVVELAMEMKAYQLISTMRAMM